MLTSVGQANKSIKVATENLTKDPLEKKEYQEARKLLSSQNKEETREKGRKRELLANFLVQKMQKCCKKKLESFSALKNRLS